MNTKTNVRSEGMAPRVKKLIFGLAVALTMALPLTVEAYGGSYIMNNPCLFSFWGPVYRCTAYGCFCSPW